MKKRAIIIEILIWAGILLVFFTGIMFAYSKFFVEPNVYNIKFKDIDGITLGSPVRFMGINVGYVRALKPKDKYINVQILVTEKNMKIPNGTVARVEFYGLGGSKSIELMPPESSNDDGFVTESTIRLADVIKETEGIVEIIELIDRYIQSVNSKDIHESFSKAGEINSKSIIKASEELSKTEKNITNKINKIKEKQKNTINSIHNANETFVKINKFIKK